MEVLGDFLTGHTAAVLAHDRAVTRTAIISDRSNGAAAGGLLRSAMDSQRASSGYSEAARLFKEAAKYYEVTSPYYHNLMHRGNALSSRASYASCGAKCKIGVCCGIFIGIPLVIVAVLFFNGTLHF